MAASRALETSSSGGGRASGDASGVGAAGTLAAVELQVGWKAVEAVGACRRARRRPGAGAHSLPSLPPVTASTGEVSKVLLFIFLLVNKAIKCLSICMEY
jgi:hypothetical protein